MNCEIYSEVCGPTAIQTFLIMMGILSTGITVSFIQTAFLCRDSSRGDVEEEYSEEEEEEETYDNKYDISHAQNVETDKVKLAKRVVVEETPNGSVLMKYSFEDDCFVYWSEFNRITYNELCTVARKFVTTHSCKDLYKVQEAETKEVDVSNNVVETSDKKEEEETVEEPKVEVVKPSVFANLKSRKNKEKQKAMTEESFETNSFKRLGSLMDFEHAPKTEVKVEEKNISYGLFKSMAL
jgi:hypothetical protein